MMRIGQGEPLFYFFEDIKVGVRRRAHQQKLAAVRISASATRKGGGDSKRSK